MLYLTNDNKIIDSSKIHIIRLCKNKIEYSETINGYTYCDLESDIKKQSENVFDLIEYDVDLIKHSCSYRDCVEIVREKKDNCIWTDNFGCKDYDILAIYKPNSNGGYDLAWEKKELEK